MSNLVGGTAIRALFFAGCLLGSGIRAEIVLDGSLGERAGALAGPDFLIDHRDGKSVGPNLFHSFETFNIFSGESATFTAPATIDNILSRVTGGSSSTIDGFLSSPANLYFFNPAGVIFGPDAWLDINGSFHVSTADYLRFGESGRFSVGQPEDSVLTTAEPSAFGFLGNSSGALSVDGSFLFVPNGETISLVGEDISISGPNLNTSLPAVIAALSGRVNVASVAEIGEVSPIGETLSATGTSGDIHIADTIIAVNGSSGGEIFIRGGDLVVENSRILAQTSGDGMGGLIDIDGQSLSIVSSSLETTTTESGQGGDIRVVTSQDQIISGIRAGIFADTGENSSGDAGSIEIKTKTLRLSDGALIHSQSRGSGNSGDINIRADEVISLVGNNTSNVNSFLSTSSQVSSTGSSGRLDIEAGSLEVFDGALISASNLGRGNGNVSRIEVREGILVSGEGIDQRGEPQPSSIAAQNQISGDPGKLELVADSLTVENGAQISTDTNGTGDAADLDIRVEGTVLVVGEGPLSGNGSLISTSTQGASDNAGSGGMLSIHAGNLRLENGGQITTVSEGPGDGGELVVSIADDVLISGRSSSDLNTQFSGFFSQSLSQAKNSGKAGDILLGAGNDITITDQGIISAETRGPGFGGNLNIQTEQLRLSDGGRISASSTGSGDAGDISLEINDALSLENGEILTEAASADGGNIDLKVGFLLDLSSSAVSTSVGTGQGNGGNIDIDPVFVILNASRIQANAFGGAGGNIRLVADQLFASPDSIIEASSALGVDGEVVIDSPDQDITSGLTNLPSNYLYTANILPIPCAQRLGADTISLVIRNFDVLPDTPYSLRTHFPAILDVDADTNAPVLMGNKSSSQFSHDPFTDCDGKF